MNQEIRQKALRGEWEPELHERYYDTEDADENHAEPWYYSGGRLHGEPPFFPTQELATEYLQVADGTWLPKDGDLVCGCSSKDLSHGWAGEHELIAWESYLSARESYFFPSVKQMFEFIAKRKGEELPIGSTVDMLDGAQRFMDKPAYAALAATKPQTIEICISEDAISRVAANVGLIIQDDWTEKFNRAIVLAVVSGLHLEATLAK